MRNSVIAFSDEDVTIGETIRRLAKLPLEFEPGVKWNYSNSIDVLGYLIEIVSGKTLDEFFKDEIFTPLGMDDTYFYLPEGKNSRLVKVQTKKKEKCPISNAVFRSSKLTVAAIQLRSQRQAPNNLIGCAIMRTNFSN